MPAAQGHITVRRRAKDGSDGNDAVRYWLVPSATQIKRAQDGTMYPSTVTCEKRKQTGNSEPIATNEGYLYYKIGYTDGAVTAKLSYGSTGVKATSGMAWIQFMLEINNIEVASETVTVVADGRSVSGVKEWYLRWAQSSGVTTNTGGWSETVPQLTQTYKYLWNYEEISFDDGTTVKTQPAIIGVYGRGIKSVTNYYLATSSSSGVTTTTAGWTTTVQSPTPEKRYLWNYEVVTYDDDSTTTTSPHIICVYGEKGDPGEDAYLLDLDNEVQGIPCDSSGTPTGTGTLASTNSTVYKGSKVDTGWSFSKEDSGCTSSINANGTVSVTAISADKASVKVTATKGSVTLTATMSLYKVKAGSNGSSPVVYSIETSVSAIGRNASGTLKTTSFTAYKNKTVGSTTSRTYDGILQYKRIGQDSNATTLSGEGGTIQGISAACTSIQIVYYSSNGTTVLDSETIPIVKDGGKGDPGDPGDPGAPGEDGYTIVVSPANLAFNYATPVVKQKVRVDVYKGSRKLSYQTEFICSTLSQSTSTPITNGLNWGFNTDTEGFYYELTYLSGRDINIDIPFVITIGELKFNSVICVTTIKNGIPGQTYKPLRVREWAKLPVGTALTSGLAESDDWTDVVYKTGTNSSAGVDYWRCMNSFTKEAGYTLPEPSDGYLQKASSFGSLATDIFLANYALIKNLGVESVEMRDSNGGVLFQAKNGVVTCNTGNFANVNVSGSLKANTLDLKISTQDHNGDSSLVPNGSICMGADRICLPELTAGSVRTIRILNPKETRTIGNDLILSRATANVRISSSLSAFDAQATEITLAECGLNGGVYLELLGYRKSGSTLTYWLTHRISEVYY